MSKFDVVVMSDELAECEDYQDWSELRRLESQESMETEYAQSKHDDSMENFIVERWYWID